MVIEKIEPLSVLLAELEASLCIGTMNESPQAVEVPFSKALKQ